MAEQQILEEDAPASPPVADAAPAAPEKQEPPRRGAIERIRALLGEKKALRQSLVEARVRLDRAEQEIERFKGELLAALAERDRLMLLDEERIRQAEEDQKAAKQAEEDRRLLAFRALVDCAHEVGTYERHSDFDARMQKVDRFFSAELLEAILQTFPATVAPELVYRIAVTDGLPQRLSALIPKFWMLTAGLLRQMATEISDELKIEALRKELEP